ncbi:DNA-binding transcriptional regulator HipB [Escherichia coli]|nr:DNA-binding transcriptional regulator HipB [Escherichia coli]
MLWTYDMMSFQKIYSPTQLANAMKLVRQQNGWTQSELAKKIGIKQATISNFENNPDNIILYGRNAKIPYQVILQVQIWCRDSLR